MKKILICFIVLITVTIGCKRDPLDIIPDGRITLDQVFANEKQTEAYLNRAYTHIPSYFQKYQFWAFLAGCTDECEDADVTNEPSNVAGIWNAGALSTSNNPLEQNGQGKVAHYSEFWAGIRDANVFLSRLPTANVPDPNNRLRFAAEAKMLRAFYYLELVKQYGAMPIIDKELAANFDYTSLKRPTFQQSIDFIVKDCDDAIAEATLPIRIDNENDRGRFSKAVAYAIKSEALLYNASPLWNPTNDVTKWQAASTASQQALAALTTNGYQLFPNYEQYFFSFSDVSPTPIDKETIYEIKEAGSVTTTITNAMTGQIGQNKVGSSPTQELVDSYEMQATGLPAIKGYSDANHLNPIINSASGYNENNPYLGRDPRFYASVWYNGSSRPGVGVLQIYKGGNQQLLKAAPNRKNTHTGYFLRKFFNPAVLGNQASSARWKKYRLAEIYLNLAEAENEANGPTNIAYNAVNAVRSRAGMPNLTPGLLKIDFQARIRNERRVEMAIEEHRFWDVRRWKILDTTDKLVTGNELIKVGNAFTYNRFVVSNRNAWADKYLIFPIPIKDASIIPDFGTNQNPGW
jgi:hypothetical protein